MEEEKAYLTQKKYDEFAHELEDLKTRRRKEVAEHLEYAKSLGDLSENAEYHEARNEQAEIEDRIGKLEEMVKSATIVSEHHTEDVSVGSEVVVQKKGQKTNKTYTIVGSEESDMKEGKISLRSPFGEAVFGHTKGEEVSVMTPKGEVVYKIVDIK